MNGRRLEELEAGCKRDYSEQIRRENVAKLDRDVKMPFFFFACGFMCMSKNLCEHSLWLNKSNKNKDLHHRGPHRYDSACQQTLKK